MKIIINKSIRKINKIIYTPYRFVIAIHWLLNINKRKMQDDIIIVLLKGIGDTLYGLSCVDSLHEKNLKSKIIVIGNAAYRDFILDYKYVNRVISYNVVKGEYKKYECFMQSWAASLIGLRLNIFNSNPYFAYKIKNTVHLVPQ